MHLPYLSLYFCLKSIWAIIIIMMESIQTIFSNILASHIFFGAICSVFVLITFELHKVLIAKHAMLLLPLRPMESALSYMYMGHRLSGNKWINKIWRVYPVRFITGTKGNLYLCKIISFQIFHSFGEKYELSFQVSECGLVNIRISWWMCSVWLESTRGYKSRQHVPHFFTTSLK